MPPIFSDWYILIRQISIHKPIEVTFRNAIKKILNKPNISSITTLTQFSMPLALKIPNWSWSASFWLSEIIICVLEVSSWMLFDLCSPELKAQLSIFGPLLHVVHLSVKWCLQSATITECKEHDCKWL